MLPPRDGRKVSLSFTNWALGGSLVNVERSSVTDKEGKHHRSVSSKLAIKVDADGNKVYTDGTVKKKERPSEPKAEPKVEKSKDKSKETGILKKTKAKTGDEEDKEDIEVSCCGKCGKTIKSKDQEGAKCKKHAHGKENSREDKKDKSKNDTKNGTKGKPNEDSKGDNTGKKNKPDQKQNGGKGDFTWTDELDKKLQEMMDADEKWTKIQSTLRTNKQNCLNRLAELRSTDQKDDAAAVKAKNAAINAAWEAGPPKTDTNPGFGASFDVGLDTGNIFGGDFGGDPLNKDKKSSWDTTVPAPATDIWGSSTKNGDNKPQVSDSWDSKASVTAATGGGDCWGGTTTIDAGVNDPWGPKPQETEAGNSHPTGVVASASGWNNDNPYVKKPSTTTPPPLGDNWGGSGDTAAKDSAATTDVWGPTPSSGSGGDANWGPSDNKSAADATGGGVWGTNDTSLGAGGDNWDSNDTSQDTSGNTGSAGPWGDNPSSQQKAGVGSNAWDTPVGQSDSNKAASSKPVNWDTPSGGNSIPAPQTGNNWDNGGNAIQSKKQGAQSGGNRDGSGVDKPKNPSSKNGWDADVQNTQGSQPQNGNGSNHQSNEGQSSNLQSCNKWCGNDSAKGQNSAAQGGNANNHNNSNGLSAHHNFNGSNGNCQVQSQTNSGGNVQGSGRNNSPAQNPGANNQPGVEGTWLFHPKNDNTINSSQTPPQFSNFTPGHRYQGVPQNSQQQDVQGTWLFQPGNGNFSLQGTPPFTNYNQGGLWQYLPDRSDQGASNGGDGVTWVPGPPQPNKNNIKVPPSQVPMFQGGFWQSNGPAPNVNSQSQGAQMQNVTSTQNNNGSNGPAGPGQAPPTNNGTGGYWQFNGPSHQNNPQGVRRQSQPTNTVPDGAWQRYGIPPPPGVPAMTAQSSGFYQSPNESYIYSQGTQTATQPQNHNVSSNTQWTSHGAYNHHPHPHIVSNGGHDIWSSHPAPPIQMQKPTPNIAPLKSALDDPNVYTYAAPGAFPSSPHTHPHQHSQAPPQTHSTKLNSATNHNSTGW